MSQKLSKFFPKIKTISLYTTATFIAAKLMASAGNLAPTEAPAPTMVTLDDLLSKIQNNLYSTSSDSQKVSISTSSAPHASMLTLRSIYDILDGMSTTSDIIENGVTIMGITGNVVIPSITDVATGTSFGPNNSLMGEYVPPAVIPPLVWSAKASTALNWNDAIVYCNNLTTDNVSWRLPKIDELIGALSEQFTSNPSVNHGFIADSFPMTDTYWSGTEQTAHPYLACHAYLGFGCSYEPICHTCGNYKTYSYSVRCVH